MANFTSGGWHNSVIFELGEQAEKWAHKILHPKSTAEKLGIKPGSRISALRLSEPEVLKDARKICHCIRRRQAPQRL